MGPRLGMGLRLALGSVLMARQQLAEALSTAQRPNLVAGTPRAPRRRPELPDLTPWLALILSLSLSLTLSLTLTRTRTQTRTLTSTYLCLLV